MLNSSNWSLALFTLTKVWILCKSAAQLRVYRKALKDYNKANRAGGEEGGYAAPEDTPSPKGPETGAPAQSSIIDDILQTAQYDGLAVAAASDSEADAEDYNAATPTRMPYRQIKKQSKSNKLS